MRAGSVSSWREMPGVQPGFLVEELSSAPEIVTAYGSRQARAAGLTVEKVPARRAINSRSTLRGPVDELIVTNARALAKLRMAKGSLPAMLNSSVVAAETSRKRA